MYAVHSVLCIHYISTVQYRQREQVMLLGCSSTPGHPERPESQVI